MRTTVIIALLFALATAAPAAPLESGSAGSAPDAAGFWAGVKSSITKHLGRPYVWGSSGLKSFDCSGFLWRVMNENGVLLKRTTARKFFMMLQPVSKDEQWKFGTVVFFDNLKHVGIVGNPQTFYHARVSHGTTEDDMNSFWRQKIYGFRRFPAP